MENISKKLIFVFIFIFGWSSVFAAEKIQFALDWKFEGPSAPYFLAIDNGHYEAEGLSVEISAGKALLMLYPKLLRVHFPSVLLILIRL